MKKIILIIAFLSLHLAHAEEKISSLKFLAEFDSFVEGKRFGPKENTIAGVIAFSVGNIGYFSTKSPILKIMYSAVQTIGILNVGRGIYQTHAPSINREMYQLIKQEDMKNLDKETMAQGLVKILAAEERAKRLALFYSSSFLAVQYTLNATLSHPPKRLKNIYIFLASVNIIAASYSGLFLGKYETFYRNNVVEFAPIVDLDGKINERYGLSFAFSF